MNVRNKIFGSSREGVPFPMSDKWYRLSPDEFRRHHLGRGFGNDLYYTFGTKLGLGIGGVMTAMDAESNGGSLSAYVKAIPRNTIGTAFDMYTMRAAVGIGGRIGGIWGSRFAAGTAAEAAGSIFGVDAVTMTRGIMAAGTVAGSIVGTGGLILATLAADAAIDVVTDGRGIYGGIMHEGERALLPELGGDLMDTAANATMRRRSLLAMKTSRFNQRSILGNEALRLATGY